MKPETVRKMEFIKQHPNYTARDLAKALNCSLHTVTSICRDFNLSFRHVNRYGPRKSEHPGDIFNVFAEQNWLM